MKLLLIRHGDPDYELDNLTPAGKLEAQYLAERIAPMPVTQYYLSPLGRAQATAAPTLKAAGREGVTFDWLQEFSIPVARPDLEGMSTVPWDWLPQDWLADPRLRSPEHWKENEIFRAAHVGEEYDKVVNAFDALLAAHGYERDGELYRVRRANTETLVFFCHLGVACVILSHLLCCSPMNLWHNVALLPTSVTILNSEERRPGTAIFRASAIGDISHLYAHQTEPSFACRFCEIYGNGDRID